MVEKVQIGNATLYCCDCADILPSLPKFDLLLTDPPYGIEITKSHRLSVSRGFVGDNWDNCTPSYKLLADIRNQADHRIIWGGNYFELPSSRCFLIWDKDNQGRDFADCEMAWTSIDAVARMIRMRPMNMDGGKVHPTQKPVAVMAWCLSHVPEPFSTVLDPFMGSGTTGVACAQAGKVFTGIERERKYFDIACKRIEAAQAQGKLFAPEIIKPVQESML